MPEGLLLRRFEAGRACEVGGQQRVQADAFPLGDGGEVGVKVGVQAQDELTAVGLLGHDTDSTTSGIIFGLNKRGSRCLTTQPPYSRRYIR